MNIIDVLKSVGFDVPKGAYQVTLDSETNPTRIRFDCTVAASEYRRVRFELSAGQRQLVLKAVQVHRVGHRMEGGKQTW